MHYRAMLRRLHQRQVICIGLLCLALTGCAGGPPPELRSVVSYPPGTAGGSSAPASARLLARLHRYYRIWAGVPYLYGGTSRHGIDCSAFVRQALASTRKTHLPRTTLAQSRRGRRIAPGHLRIGDLVFFRINGGRHVGIYMGNNRFMHASTSVGVTISRLDNVYWRRHFWQARRLP